ncbi:N-acylneuraminate-9-phosphate synthase, partial [Candidatus Magnetomorum sp. HK-1]
YHLLKYIAQTKKKIYLSTGMATLKEISETLNFLELNRSGPITLMHCVSMYPPQAQHLNLEIIPLMKKLFDIPSGYSDHFPGTMACLLAAILGASTIETHFTLDSCRKTGDHFHSVNPDDLKQLIENISLFTTMRGKLSSVFQKADRDLIYNYRRGLFSAKNLPKGKLLQENDFLFCRPKTILSPNEMESLIGKKLLNDVAPYQPIEPFFVDKYADKENQQD